MRNIKTALPYLAGMAFIPCLLIASYLLEGGDVGNGLMSATFYVAFYPPLLALVAAFSMHFKHRHAVYPILLMPLADFVFAPLLQLILTNILSDVTPELLGKSALVVLGPVIAIIAIAHRASMFRFLTAVLGLAQCVTLVLFHFVTLSAPMEAMVEQERHLMESLITRDGSPEGLCGLSGTLCTRGTVEDTMQWAQEHLHSSEQSLNFLRDTREVPKLNFTWMETSDPQGSQDISLVTVQKFAPNQVLMLVNTEGPSILNRSLNLGLGILIAAFHEIWIVLVLAVLARHGDYSFRNWRWRRDG